MAMRARIWWGGGALLLALAGGGLYVQQRSGPAPLPAGARPIKVQTASAQAWPVGERRNYAVTLSSKHGYEGLIQWPVDVGQHAG
jgi:hypothetical protein